MYPILISFPEIFVRASVIGHRDLHHLCGVTNFSHHSCDSIVLTQHVEFGSDEKRKK